jgi:hypothetical protein
MRLCACALVALLLAWPQLGQASPAKRVHPPALLWPMAALSRAGVVDAATIIGESLHGFVVGATGFGQFAKGGQDVCDRRVSRARFRKIGSIRSPG